MITFKNGKTFDFGCAAGALGFNGKGYWFEQPWRWFGWLRTAEMTIITTTLTFMARKGNYQWWRPWRSIRSLGDGTLVNCKALTNKGYEWWIDHCYPGMFQRGLKIIPSIMAENIHEMRTMIKCFNLLPGLDAVQINPFCPNIDVWDDPIGHAIELCQEAKVYSIHPIVVKLTYHNDYPRVLRTLDGVVDAFELINTMPFPMVCPNEVSPLSKYGYPGAVSGQKLKKYAREAVVIAHAIGIKTPIIAGGGIDTIDEVYWREAAGAKGFVFGTLFPLQPSKPNMIINQYRAKVKVGVEVI